MSSCHRQRTQRRSPRSRGRTARRAGNPRAFLAQLEHLEPRLALAATNCPDTSSDLPTAPDPTTCPSPFAAGLQLQADPAASAALISRQTTAPIDAYSGVAAISAVDVSAGGFGATLAHTRTWSGMNNTGRNGNGWATTSQPYLIVYNTFNPSTKANDRPVIGYVESSQNMILFDATGSGPWVGRFYGGQTLSYDPTNARWTVRDAVGTSLVFNDLPRDASGALSANPTVGYANQALFGAIVSRTDPGGAVTTWTYGTTGATANLPVTIERTDAATGAAQRLAYGYANVTNSLGGAAVLISAVTLEMRATSSASYVAIRSATYDYYTGEGTDAAYGRFGDLELVTTRDGAASGPAIDHSYYRYSKLWGYVRKPDKGPLNDLGTTGGTDMTYPRYTSAWNDPYYNFYQNPDNNLWSGLTVVVGGSAYARMAANVASYATATTTALTPYADHVFRYDRWGDARWNYETYATTDFASNYHVYTRYRVAEEIAHGTGCSTCSGGQGTFAYQMLVNASATGAGNDEYDPNVWRMRTTEYFPDTTNPDADGDGRIDASAWADNDRKFIYMNEVGQVLLTVKVDVGDSVYQATSIARSARTVTVVSAGHGLTTGEAIVVSGAKAGSTGLPPGIPLGTTLPMYDGVFRVTVLDTNTFTYSLGASPSHTALPDLAAFAWAPVVSQQADYYRYSQDSASGSAYAGQGRLVLHAFPSAVSGFDEFYPGLVTNGLSDSYNNQFLRDDAGLIELYTYYSSTTATETVAGGAAGRAWQTKVKQGEKDGGSNILGGGITVARKQYYARTFGPTGATVTTFPLATDTRYRNADGTGLETTSYAYTWYPGGARPERIVTTLPTATTAQNGPNSGDTTTSVYDIYGRETWTQDGDGFLHFREYDVLTGAVTKSIVDVDTTQTGTFSGLPAGWATPTGGGLHLTTTVQVDGLGRTTRQADAGGSVTFTVYNDPAHEVRVYRGWNATTGTTTGPVEVAREYRPATPGGAATTTVYRETLTTSAAPSTMLTSAGLVPTGTESITAANLQSLVRAVTNNAGQVVETDRYFSFSGIAYSPTTLYLGTAGTASAVGNYHPTMTDYDSRGVVKRAVEPSGTITRRVYDGFERIVAVWVGTDDTPTAGFWSPSNTVGTDLVKVAAYEYDNGLSGGDGLLTTVTQIPGLGAPDRVTRMAYDWRGRLVVTKAGVEAVEDPSVNRLLTFTDYDNADRPLRSSQYDGDGVGIADANADGVPDQPAAALLRGQVTSEYDNRGRVFRETRYGVDPASGVVGAGLTTAFWRDRRDNVIKVQAPGAATQKFQYDGAGRAIVSFLSDGGGDATWSDAKTVTGDAVLEQTDVTFDGASNMILVHTRQRFHDATGTGALQALTSSTRPSRSAYQASYYDAANRLTASVNVGTNGGVAYARPSTVPARSDTALVTTYAYDAAGRVQDVTDPRGIVSRTLSDALGRTTATIANYTGGAPGAQADVTTLFTFDFAGRLASRTAVQPAGTPSQVTGYVYGVSPATGSAIASNDILAETRYPDPATGLPSATDRDVSTTNALGERTSFTDRAGTTHAYAYDVLGRQTADTITALGAGVDGAVRRIESAYDALGRVTSVTSFAAPSSGTVLNQVTRTFNGFGQITSEWQAHTGLVDPATTPQIQYAYSEGSGGNHSRLTRITYPDGYQLTYAYTGLDSVVSRPTSLSGQSAGSAAAVTLEAFKYLGLGTVIERTRPEVNAALSMVSVTGATGDAGDKYTGLDRFGRVVDQRWTQGTTATSPVLDRYGYTYDRNSNRLTRSNALAAAFGETYAYDALNQLQSFSRTGGTTTSQQWQFDAAGNWTTFTTNGVAQTHTANAQNEVTQVGGSALAYSQTGTLTTDAEGRTLAYDAWNRLVSVKNASGVEVARYAYDGLNRRVVEQVGTPAAPAAASAPIRDVYYSQEWQAVEERVRTSTGAIPAIADTRFIWSPVYVDAMVARDRNADDDAATGPGGLEERVYALQDANWNTTAILAATGVPGVAAGTVINRFVYTPYGESQTLTASWATPAVGSTPATPWTHLFQGLEFTAVTGLAYVRHRDYSATIGRFIELDPIGFQAGDSNWYRFVGNGPIGKTDPSGLEECTSNYPGTAINFDHFRRLTNGTNVTEDIIQQHARDIALHLAKQALPRLGTPAAVAKLAANLPLKLAKFVLFNNFDDHQLFGLSAGGDGRVSVRTVNGRTNQDTLVPNSGKPVTYTAPCPGKAIGVWETQEVAKNWCELYDALYEAYVLMQAVQSVSNK
jgi:RHS repeat-associated protein